MTRLRTFCDTHGIRLVEDHEHPYERGFLYTPLLKIVVAFDNTTEQDTELLIEGITNSIKEGVPA